MGLSETRRDRGFSHCPAIVENGAGVVLAGDVDAVELDQSEYQKLLGIICAAPKKFGMNFTGFADWSLDEIASKTGLFKLSCKKAAARQLSEPGLWSGTTDDLASYKARLTDHGVTLQSGGRFIMHSFGADKTKRMAQISDCCRSNSPTMKTLALSDAPNDIGMLEAADRGVIVLNSQSGELPILSGEQRGTIARTQLPRPQGWNAAVLSYLASAKLQ